MYPEATEAFLSVKDNPFFHLMSTILCLMYRSALVILYDTASLATDVNTARRELFTKKNRALENIFHFHFHFISLKKRKYNDNPAQPADSKANRGGLHF